MNDPFLIHDYNNNLQRNVTQLNIIYYKYAIHTYISADDEFVNSIKLIFYKGLIYSASRGFKACSGWLHTNLII